MPPQGTAGTTLQAPSKTAEHVWIPRALGRYAPSSDSFWHRFSSYHLPNQVTLAYEPGSSTRIAKAYGVSNAGGRKSTARGLIVCLHAKA